MDINNSVIILVNCSSLFIENATNSSASSLPPDVFQLLIQNLSGVTAIIAVVVTGFIAIMSNRHNAKLIKEQLTHQQKMQYITTFKHELMPEIESLKKLIGNGNKKQITEFFSESKYIPFEIQDQINFLNEKIIGNSTLTQEEKNQANKIIDHFFVG